MRLISMPVSTRRRSGKLLWFSWCFALTLGSPAVTVAQDDFGLTAPGFQPGRNYMNQLPFEHIDAYSGALILSFTDLVLQGNGGMDCGLRWQRTFNSKAVVPSVA